MILRWLTEHNRRSDHFYIIFGPTRGIQYSYQEDPRKKTELKISNKKFIGYYFERKGEYTEF